MWYPAILVTAGRHAALRPYVHRFAVFIFADVVGVAAASLVLVRTDFFVRHFLNST